MDIIFIRELRLDAAIGVYDWEQKIRQPLLLDLELGWSLQAAGFSDDLSLTLDYDRLSRELLAWVAVQRFELIEALAEHLAQWIQTEFGVPWLRMTLTKPGAVRRARAVGLRIERGQPS